MAGLVVDTSVWIEVFAGAHVPAIEDALSGGTLLIPPLVVAELVSGADAPEKRAAIGEILQEAPVHETFLDHWIRVGELRRMLAGKGLSVSIPDAHIAQCALDRDAVLLTRDAIFKLIAKHTRLRLG